MSGIKANSFALMVLIAVYGCGSGTSSKQPAAAPAGPSAEQPTAPDQPTTAPAPDGQPAAPAALQNKDVVGSFKTDGGDFEEITINADGTWSSYLHSRPFYSGTWTLSESTLTLTSEAAGAPMVFAEITVTDKGIEAKKNGKKVQWARVTTP
jgi:hypothetical protein